jgi:immune inhibitor A
MEQGMRNGVFRTLFLILILTLGWSFGSFASPLMPEVAERLRREGKLQEWLDQWQSAAERGMYAKNPANELRFAKRNSGELEIRKPLVICVDFSDNPHSYSIDTLDWLLFSQGHVVPTGSFRDYYLENSYRLHDPQGSVYGWVRAPQTYAYYTDGQKGLGIYPKNSQKLVEDVLAAVDASIDFKDYDYDHDGWIDGLMIVHAGPGAEETGNVWQMWSHRWSINQQTRDDVKISSYTMQPEEHELGALNDIGVFCHEYGHDLGILWEEYDRDYTSGGLGDWSVMALGCFNNGGKTPAHHSAYCKYVLGWTNMINVTSNLSDTAILQAETQPVCYRLWTSGLASSQYFLVENRQKTRFDSYLPGEGLLIYHVDQSRSNNDQEWCPGDPGSAHPKIALEQADGWFGIEGCGVEPDEGDGGDPFPGYTEKRAFDDTTSPSSRDYYGNTTQVAVWNISDPDSVVHANLDVTWSRPNLVLESFWLVDSSGGDGDGKVEPGETVDLFFSLSNDWKDLTGAWVVASADTEGISFPVDSVQMGNVISGGTTDNSGNPIRFNVAAGFPSKVVDFTLTICGDGGSYCTERVLSIAIGHPGILLVDDDNQASGSSDYGPLYRKSLDFLGLVYDCWDKAGDPYSPVDLSLYPVVIWFTGDQRADVLSAADVQDLMDYLDGGGRLFLTSQDAAEKLSTSGEQIDSVFLADYLHASYGGVGDRSYAILPDYSPGDSLYLFLGGYDAPDNQMSKDILIPDSPAFKMVEYADVWFAPTDSVAGATYEGNFKVVLFGFGFEAIDSSGRVLYGKTLSTPAEVMQSVLDWLQAPSHAGSIALSSAIYRGTQAHLVATVTDPDLNVDADQLDTVSIRIESSSDQTGIGVLCTESGVNSGVFTGSCGFVLGASDDYNDSISVSDEDTVFAIYSDQSPPADRMAKAVWSQKTDLDPPVFTVGILQNPVFSAELEIYAVASESLQTAPTMTAGTDTLEVDYIEYDETVIYVSHYSLTGSANIQIKVAGVDMSGNPGSHSEIFAAGRISPSGGDVTSCDGILHLDVSAGAVDELEYFLVFAADQNGGLVSESPLASFDVRFRKPEVDGALAAYSITPSDFQLRSHAVLSFDLETLELHGGDPAGLVIQRLDGNDWISILTHLDLGERRVRASVYRLGTYRVALGETPSSGNTPTTYALENNYPNPFNHSTVIGYQTPSAGWVRVEIYNLLGQEVRTLVNEDRPAGKYTVEWDGLNQDGEEVSSGIYFCRLSAQGFSQTKKMTFLK